MKQHTKQQLIDTTTHLTNQAHHPKPQNPIYSKTKPYYRPRTFLPNPRPKQKTIYSIFYPFPGKTAPKTQHFKTNEGDKGATQSLTTRTGNIQQPILQHSCLYRLFPPPQTYSSSGMSLGGGGEGAMKQGWHFNSGCRSVELHATPCGMEWHGVAWSGMEWHVDLRGMKWHGAIIPDCTSLGLFLGERGAH